MASQSAAFAGAAPDQSVLGWLVAIPLGCLMLVQVLLALTGVVPILDGTLADSDAYMRLRACCTCTTAAPGSIRASRGSIRPKATSSTGRGHWMRCCWAAPGCCSRSSASSGRCISGAC